LIALIENPVERAAYSRRLALATDSDAAAVDSIVRGCMAKRRRSAAPSEREAARVSDSDARSAGTSRLARPQRDASGAERKLAQLAQLLFKKPELVNGEVQDRIEELVPDGSWKSILRHILAAAREGYVDGSGAVDLLRVEGQLDAEAGSRLHALAVSELFEEIESSPEAILEDHFAWFSNQQRAAAGRDLRRRLSDPQADVDALLAERQRQLEEKRAAHGIATEPVP
jgi:hypothetical protein